MPYINVQMLAGRSVDQKRELAKAITDSVASICKAKPEFVYVVIEDVEKENWAVGGTLAEYK